MDIDSRQPAPGARERASQSVAAVTRQPPFHNNRIVSLAVPLPPTCHHAPWRLIGRNGDTLGKRLSTRMAYLTGAIAGLDGQAVALRGYIMRNDMTGWTKHPRRIEWCDVIKLWRCKPAPTDVRKVKARLPIAAPSTNEAANPKEEQTG